MQRARLHERTKGRACHASSLGEDPLQELDVHYMRKEEVQLRVPRQSAARSVAKARPWMLSDVRRMATLLEVAGAAGASFHAARLAGASDERRRDPC